MKAYLDPLLIVFIFLFNEVVAQTTRKALLQFRSYVFTLGVSKEGKLLIGTALGEMAFADSVNGFWHESWFSKDDRRMPGKLIVSAVISMQIQLLYAVVWKPGKAMILFIVL